MSEEWKGGRFPMWRAFCGSFARGDGKGEPNWIPGGHELQRVCIIERLQS